MIIGVMTTTSSSLSLGISKGSQFIMTYWQDLGVFTDPKSDRTGWNWQDRTGLGLTRFFRSGSGLDQLDQM